MVAGASPADGDKTAANRERADRRRAVQRAVRSERERLTSTTGTRPAFDYELLLTYARNRASAAYALPLLVGIVAATGLSWIQPSTIIAWASLVLAVHVATLSVCRRFSTMQAGGLSIKNWTRRFIIAEAVGGIAWAAVLVLASLYGRFGDGL